MGGKTDSPGAALCITRKEGPARNEIFSIQEKVVLPFN